MIERGEHVVIVGGGIAGVEAALTLERTLPGAHVTLVVRTPELRIRPNLVYLALGETDSAATIPLTGHALGSVELCVDVAVSIDRAGHRVRLASGRWLPWSTLILAPGTVPRSSAGRRLRTMSDAHALHDSLVELAHHPRPLHGLLIRDLPDDTWSPPAWEMAFLVDGWLRAQGMRDRIGVTIATSAHTALETFGPHVSDEVQRQVDTRHITCILGVPPGRIEQLSDDLVIDVGGFAAARIAGEPPAGSDGFFATDARGQLAPGIYVVGDAADVPFKGAFTSSWQARRIARALGGDISLLGDTVDGIPIDDYEYQMDLAGQVLVVRMSTHGLTTPLGRPRTTHLDVVPGRPVKLRGTLIREQLLVNPLYIPAVPHT